MLNLILSKTLPATEINVKEILRYAGVKQEVDKITAELNTLIGEHQGIIEYKVCYGEFDICKKDGVVDFGFMNVRSKSLSRLLSNCESAFVFAATLGLNIDRAIYKYSKTAPYKALLLQAFATERIEALCDCFCNEIREQKKKENKFTTARFSAGYGDFKLEHQREIFCALNCAKNIGLTLNDSLLMSPTKSVTAVFGVSKAECKNTEKCNACNLKVCPFRR